MESIQGMTKEARAARRTQWVTLIAEQQAGTVSAAVFCRTRGIAAWQFSYWRKILTTPKNTVAKSGFAEILPISHTSGVWVEAGRWRVGVAMDFNAVVLRRTLEVLAGS